MAILFRYRSRKVANMFWKWKYLPKVVQLATPKKEPLFMVSSIKKRCEELSSDEENID